jgi:TPR repeat protein
MYNLGFAYFTGQGVDKGWASIQSLTTGNQLMVLIIDLKTATEYIKRAADQGLVDAQFSMGAAYENGELTTTQCLHIVFHVSYLYL